MKIKKPIKKSKRIKIEKPKISWLESLDKMTLGELADELLKDPNGIFINDDYNDDFGYYYYSEGCNDDISIEKEQLMKLAIKIFQKKLKS